MRFLLLLLLCGHALAAGPDPASVVVLYNKAVPESAKLAQTYRAARDIPEANLVGLELPKSDEMSRAEYEDKLANPLRAEFTRQSWWQLGKNPENLTLPVRNKIRFIAVMRGVPLRIRNTSANPPPIDLKKPFEGRNEAAVDSELAMFGIQGLPTTGTLDNKFFKSTRPVTQADVPFMVLVSRIDAARWETCERMIRDAIAAEKTGLWGMAYVDIANKFPEGDQWLETVAKETQEKGIPTVIDRFNDTLPTNYPMTDAALYYGWYEWNVNGPFLNSGFRFRPGAVAMHLHSFSAEQIRDPNKNWSAALLERGAACTIGNVYEPYLQATHYFDILNNRLLQGWTFAEAAAAAMPTVSWQGVAFGDPLYRPFLHLEDGGGEQSPPDNDYRALRLATIQWGGQPAEWLKQIEDAATRTRSGIFSEAVGLRQRAAGRTAEALQWFTTAKTQYPSSALKLRQDFHLITLDRVANRKDDAIRKLREARTLYTGLPEASAVTSWLNILDPPPPPPADPTKIPPRR